MPAGERLYRQTGKGAAIVLAPDAGTQTGMGRDKGAAAT